MIKSEGRVLARTALVFTVFMSLLYLVLSGNAGGFGTAGAQVSPTSGYSIQWVNPDTDSNTEVSAQNKQGLNNSNSYHLAAWVNRLPADAFVEFCIDDCNPSSERITPENDGADFVSPDTFEHFWTTLPAEGAYTLRARLFSGAMLLAEDTVSVTVNNAVESPAPPNSESEGIEITDPANGGELGFYRPPDTTLYTAVLDVAASTGTTLVEAKYTISAPGTDPIWKSCGTESTDEAQADGLRCELEEGDSADDVTAVGAVAYDDPTAGGAPDLQSQFREGGDAHRIDGYTQVPESLSLDFVAADGTAQGDVASTNPATCSPLLRATVIDQNGESVPQVNVDFHARGPDDDIRFVQVADNPMKAPDLGGHTATDPASNCSGSNTGTQGEHDSPADDDTKHVESTDNTNDAGQFTVQLYHGNSGEVPGVTQISAWGDLDGNDQFCSREPSDNAAIGWGQTATASGVPSETTSCILPGATPSSSPSATPSASSTGSTTPTTTTTTTTTPTPTRKRVASTTTIDFGRGKFKGVVRSSNKKCRMGRLVKVKKQKRGRDATVGKDRTNRSGSWSEREARARGRYYAVAAKKRFTQRNGTIVICRSDKSPTVRVRRG